MKSFIRKVEAERTVLRMVNQRSSKHQLNGLNPAAIAAWATTHEIPEEKRAQIQDIGRKIGLMCERSGERDASDFQNQKEVASALKRFSSNFRK